ncbi:hypothetical protein [Mucilaginibacter sp. 5C4]|uniref:hypothetical protein n=1 Tax=Mucilaginibacter sp. 5C4 TaxID=3048589 RepID=UPI002B2258EA|nr:hypothetical protein [Mucilaginibacter sp. 5C4]MEB0278496.1 hypothetical protein [Mucilaginibacter sp. 10B2]MEB0300716.1 hypothetical protein [Mucilaginibacter sp. 5C4]
MLLYLAAIVLWIVAVVAFITVLLQRDKNGDFFYNIGYIIGTFIVPSLIIYLGIKVFKTGNKFVKKVSL